VTRARVGFAGTSAWAAACLGVLVDDPALDVAIVLSQPDRPAGRGRGLRRPPVAERAVDLGLPLLQPARPAEALDDLRAAAVGAIAVVAYGELVPRVLLDLRPWLNLHPSRLPRWRGAAPIERAIMAGDPRTGVSIMRLTAGLDSGPVCLQGEEPIRPDDDFGTLAGRLEALGSALLARALDERPPFEEQDEAGLTYAEKIGPADRALQPARPVGVEERRVRALRPHIGARLALPDGGWLGVVAAVPAADAVEPGRVRADGARLLVGCADGALELTEIQPPGARPMPAAAWLRGRGPGGPGG
jgi:methionyl-tRNA formyltransferase